VTKCRSKPRCGVCSEEHLTDVCIQKIKNGTKPTAKCPNCGLGHHAWNPVCEERRKCLNIPPGLRSSRLKVHKVAQQLRPVSTNSPPSSSLHNPTRIYTRAVTDAADASSPSASIISIPPRPICHCNSQSDTTRDMEILTSILQMGLLLVGRQVDQQHVQALVSNVLAVSKVLITPDGNQTSSTSSVNPSTLVGPGLPTASLHRPASPLGIDGTSVPTPDQPPTPDYSQRKRFRRSSSGSEGELMPRVQAHIPDDQPLLTEFPLPRPTTANIYPSTDGSPPVIRIPECTDNSMDSFADQSASPTSSELVRITDSDIDSDNHDGYEQ